MLSFVVRALAPSPAAVVALRQFADPGSLRDGMYVLCAAAAVAAGVTVALRVMAVVWRMLCVLCGVARLVFLCVFRPAAALEEGRRALEKAMCDADAPKAESESAGLQRRCVEAAGVAVSNYVRSPAFRELLRVQIEIVRDERGAAERRFASQERGREEAAWLRLFDENRRCFRESVQKKLLFADSVRLEKTRVAGFERAFGRDEAGWTADDKIHFAKRLVADLFDSDNLPVKYGEEGEDDEHTKVITHVNHVQLCGRIYVETIDNWNSRVHYDPSRYVRLNAESCGEEMLDVEWTRLHEADRAERRARLSEDEQDAQDLAEAVEADRVAARDLLTANTRVHRSGNAYVR